MPRKIIFIFNVYSHLTSTKAYAGYEITLLMDIIEEI